jgi:hypothetical protein
MSDRGVSVLCGHDSQVFQSPKIGQNIRPKELGRDHVRPTDCSALYALARAIHP